MYAWPEQAARHLIDERIRDAAVAARGRRARRHPRRHTVSKLIGRLNHHEIPAASPVD